MSTLLYSTAEMHEMETFMLHMAILSSASHAVCMDKVIFKGHTCPNNESCDNWGVYALTLIH